MPLPEDFIYKLKQNNPIDTVMSGYAVLKKKSRGYVCLCPFHSEKTPSCTVYPDSFYCFGCGTGGDVITFIMKAENLTYIEAVKFLAEKAGMQMPDEAKNNDYSRLKAKILEMNRTAARYFFDILAKSPDGEKARRYLHDRGLKNATITKYGLGYAPGDWDRLRRYMNENGFSDEELITANLCARSQKGRVYDMFRDRVMFPIIDVRGNVIAFGGRIIDGSGPKYLNTSDTPVFKKSGELFSLNFARKSGEKKFILAEGYMDVITINQAGFENVVAALGTAFTAENARNLRRYADEVVVAFDSDEAGTEAKLRAINIFTEANVKIRVLDMEGAKDPDEYIKKFGPVRFGQLVENSSKMLDFEFEKLLQKVDIESDEGRLEFLKKCTEFIANIDSRLDREIYITKLAKQTGAKREVIDAEIENIQKKKRNTGEKRQKRDVINFTEQRKRDPESVAHMREYKAEKGIISYLSLNPDELPYIESRITPDYFVTDFNRQIYEKLVSGIKNSSYFNIMSLQSEFTADEMGKITEIIVGSQDIVIDRGALDDYIDVLADYKENRADVGDMSDDEFKNFFENINKSKINTQT